VSARSSSELPAAERERLAELIASARSVVALTGAGISVPSGIPDFRSPGSGLWERVDPMKVAHIDAFRSDPASFWGFYRERFASLGESSRTAPISRSPPSSAPACWRA
jgi:NAD-dependent deacetylase